MPVRRLLLLFFVLASSASADDALPEGAVRRMTVTEDGSGSLFCVAFSPDGKTIAVGGSLRRVHLFDVKSGELLRSFGSHPDNVWTVAWSPDGKLLCSGGRSDVTLRVWDPKTGDELKPFDGHQGGITRIKFFRDGKRLIMSGGSWDPMIRVWDVEQRAQLMAMSGHADLIDAMDLAPHGRLAISGCRDGTLRLWDLTRGSEVWRETVTDARATGDGPGYAAVAFSPDGRSFASAADSGVFEVRETITRRRWLPASDCNGIVNAIAFSPDGRRLAFTRGGNKLVIWDARTGEELRVRRGHQSRIRGLAFAPDGRTLASCGDDATIFIWKVPAVAEDEKRELTDVLRAGHLDVLDSENPVIARYAIRALANDTGPAVAALARRLKPAEAGDQKVYEQWIADLTSRSFADRERATTELERAGERAEVLLQLAFTRSTDTEQRRRVERLLERLLRRPPPSEVIWHLRAVQVLELRADAESREQLRRLAAGAPSRLTTEAREALERLR